MHRGYIKIWRKMMDSFIFQDSQVLHLWVHLLLEANHKDKEFLFNYQKQICKRGQVIVGRKTLSQKTGISQSKVYRILKMLKIEQLIEQQKTNRFTLITVLNYNLYQGSEQQNEQPVNNKRTTSEQPVNTNNNVKNDKNEKNDYREDFEKLWTSYPNRIGKRQAEAHFRASVKNDKDYADIQKALETYKNSDRVKKGFIQNGSTWFNNWKDWLEVGGVVDPMKKKLDEILHKDITKS